MTCVRLPSTVQSIGYGQCSWGLNFAVPDTIDPVTLGAFITYQLSVSDIHHEKFTARSSLKKDREVRCRTFFQAMKK